jgi:hypothetical protein
MDVTANWWREWTAKALAPGYDYHTDEDIRMDPRSDFAVLRPPPKGYWRILVSNLTAFDRRMQEAVKPSRAAPKRTRQFQVPKPSCKGLIALIRYLEAGDGPRPGYVRYSNLAKGSTPKTHPLNVDTDALDCAKRYLAQEYPPQTNMRITEMHMTHQSGSSAAGSLVSLMFLGLIAWGIFSLVGSSFKVGDFERHLGGGANFSVWTDPSTGCQYIVTRNGTTPRLDPAGKQICNSGKTP